MPNDTLRLEVLVASTVRAGDSVDIVLRLTNVTERTIEVHLQGRETVFDLLVRDAGGQERWRRLAGVANILILALKPLAAGASMEFRHQWDQRGPAGPLPPGEYTVTGELPSDAPMPLRSPPAQVRIETR